MDLETLLAPCHSSWRAIFAKVAPELQNICHLLEQDIAQGELILPAPAHIMRAFQYPIEHTKVLIVGQDPYPNPKHAIGLAFAVPPEVKPLPPSLRNILQECATDLGTIFIENTTEPSSNLFSLAEEFSTSSTTTTKTFNNPTPITPRNLSRWTEQGVMLLNRVLTVRAGASNSHARWGWELITDLVVSTLDKRDLPLVAVLWGKPAGKLQKLLPNTATITGVHPSPLSAYRGFFGSRPFSKINALLQEQGAYPINW